MKNFRSFGSIAALAVALCLGSAAVAQTPPACDSSVGLNLQLHSGTGALKGVNAVSFWCEPTKPYGNWTLVYGFVELGKLAAADQSAVMAAALSADKPTLLRLAAKTIPEGSARYKAAVDHFSKAFWATMPPPRWIVTSAGPFYGIDPDNGKTWVIPPAQVKIVAEEGARASCGQLMATIGGQVYCTWWKGDRSRAYPNVLAPVRRAT